MARKPGAAARTQTFDVLLVEDADGDAKLIADYLEGSGDARFRVVRVATLTEALETARHSRFDAIGLDLSLPDSHGPSGVRALCDLSRAPVLVLTGHNEEDLAIECLQAGADDYLRKAEMEPRSLARAFGYAILRRREEELRTLAEARNSYTAMTSSPVASGQPRLSSLQARDPGGFHQVVMRYYETLIAYTAAARDGLPKPREGMADIAQRLFSATSSTRDLIILHTKALDIVTSELPLAHQAEIVVEGRLFALEMMGAVLELYRTDVAGKVTESSRAVPT
ncbi:response regulator receiver protein [Stappia sp. 22II-S9-Z10]|nr:response regulator receiver protein [Stappia sp. 22II-S9-Z10]